MSILLVNAMITSAIIVQCKTFLLAFTLSYVIMNFFDNSNLSLKVIKHELNRLYKFPKEEQKAHSVTILQREYIQRINQINVQKGIYNKFFAKSHNLQVAIQNNGKRKKRLIKEELG